MRERKKLIQLYEFVRGSIINKLLWGRARRSRCIGKCLEANFEWIRDKNFWKVSFWWGVRMYENIQSRHYLAINKVLSLSACHYHCHYHYTVEFSELQNMGVAVENSQLSCMHAELYIFSVIEQPYWIPVLTPSQNIANSSVELQDYEYENIRSLRSAIEKL